MIFEQKQLIIAARNAKRHSRKAILEKSFTMGMQINAALNFSPHQKFRLIAEKRGMDIFWNHTFRKTCTSCVRV